MIRKFSNLNSFFTAEDAEFRRGLKAFLNHLSTLISTDLKKADRLNAFLRVFSRDAKTPQRQKKQERFVWLPERIQNHEKNDLRKRVYESRLFHGLNSDSDRNLSCFGIGDLKLGDSWRLIPAFKSSCQSCLSLLKTAFLSAAPYLRMKQVFNAFKPIAFSCKRLASPSLAFKQRLQSAFISVNKRFTPAFPLRSFLSAIVPQCGTKEDATSAVKSVFSLALFAFRKSAIVNAVVLTKVLALATVGFLAVNPAFAQTNPAATSTRFVRGSGTNPDYTSFILPLGSQKGVQLLQTNSGSSIPNASLPWWHDQVPKSYGTGGLKHYDSTSNSYSISFVNPLVAFGSSSGATPLFLGQAYPFAFFAGARYGDYANPFIRILVYAKNNLAAGPVGTIEITIPQKGTAAWTQFVADGGQKVVEAYGLSTLISLAESSDIQNRFGTTQPSPYLITHIGKSQDFYYRIEAKGGVQPSTTMQAMVVDSTDQPTFEPLYTLDFDQKPAYTSTYLDQPHFEGKPLPSTYIGKSVEELLAVKTPIPAISGLPAPASAKQLDHSPELRSHPLLDEFVNQRKVGDSFKDALYFTNYVLNNIELTDFIAYNENGTLDEKSVNLGGLSRGALATYIEGAGSPCEQCALLIYLLRKADIPAVFVEPQDDKLKILDKRVSQLFRMQIKGAIGANGQPADLPSLIPVNYPWVAAYVNGAWVNLFPWMKDTEIKEGRSFYEFLPAGETIFKWIQKYLNSDPTIVSKIANENSPLVLFPRYLEGLMRRNNPNLSIDQIGMTYRDRRNYFARFEDLPAPFIVEGTPTVRESFGAQPNRFNVARVQILRSSDNSVFFDCGDIRLTDLHNRRFVVRHEKNPDNSIQMVLSLAPYREGTTADSAFTDTNEWINRKIATIPLVATDDQFTLRVETKYQRTFTTTVAPGTQSFLDFQSLRNVINQTSFRKGDVVALNLFPGRVSEAMVRVHGDEFLAIQAKLKNEVGYQPSPDIYQGASAYIMGLQYFEKVNTYAKTLGSLYKLNPVAVQSAGFAKLSAKRDTTGNLIFEENKISIESPSVDMQFHLINSIFNSQVHPDLPGSNLQAQKDYSAMLVVGASAEEHLVLNRYLDAQGAISAVALLQKAGKEKPGGFGIITLTKANYLSEGEKLYNSIKLKDHDPAIWTIIANNFGGAPAATPESDYQVIFVTPGKQTVDGYPAMAALILTDIGSDYYRQYGLASLITGPDGVPLNGGFFKNIFKSIARFFSGIFETIAQFTISVTDKLVDIAYKFIVKPLFIDLPNIVAFDILNLDTIFGKDVGKFITKFRQIQSQVAEIAYKTVTGFVQGINQYIYEKGVQFLRAAENPFSANFYTFQLNTIGDPVSVVTGEFYLNTVDLALPGPLPMEVRRNYSSQNVATGDFGIGWKLGYNCYLAEVKPNELYMAAEPDGTTVLFRKQSTPDANGNELWIPEIKDNPHFANFNGGLIGGVGNFLHSKLVKTTAPDPQNAALTNTFYSLTYPNGAKKTFKVQKFPIPAIKDGLQITLDRERPYLQKWEDNRGNFLSFEYGVTSSKYDYGYLKKITSSAGSYLGFVYDFTGRIIESFTSDSRSLFYSYNKDGDLIKVLLPDGAVVEYEYQFEYLKSGDKSVLSSNHLITREIHPEGRILENIYDDKRRVVKQRAVVGNDRTPVRNADYEYYDGFTLVRDAYNGVSRYDLKENQIIKTTDALAQEETREWFSKDHVPGQDGGYPLSIKKITDKRGLTTEYTYDNRGNPLTTTMRGDLNGDGVYNSSDSADNTVTSTDYNDKNMPTRTIDNLGNRTYFFYENSTYPFLLTKTEKRVMNGTSEVVVSRSLTEYSDVTEGSYTTKGVVTRERQLAEKGLILDTYAETLTEVNVLGYPKKTTKKTGTSDPDMVEEYTYNSRGELIESRLMDEANTPRIKKFYNYDNMGRKTWEEIRDGATNKLLSWNYNYYNHNGELEWSDGPAYGPEDYVWNKYDGAGRLTESHAWRSQANADGTGVEELPGKELYATTFYRYDTFGALKEVRSPRGTSVTMEHDALGRVILKRVHNGDGKSPVISTEKMSYEPGGQVATVTSPTGAIARTFYTADGKVRRKEAPDGSVAEFKYDNGGRILKEIHPNGTTTEMLYDDVNLIVTTQLKKGATVLTSTVKKMDLLGRTIEETDPLGNKVTTTYDLLNRVKTRTGPSATSGTAQQTTTTTYDKSGKVLLTTNSLGEKSKTVFDSLQRPLLTQILNNANTVIRQTSYQYSEDHHSVTVTQGTGANAITSTSFTDTYGKPVLTRFADGKYATNTYDAAGMLISSRDELGKITTMTYDGKGRLKTQTLPDGAKTSFTYNNLDQVLERIMPANTREANSYDQLGRLLSTEWKSTGQSTKKSTFTYHTSGPNIGLLNTTTDPRGITYTTYYDDFLRRSSVVATPASGKPEEQQTTTFAYDNRSLITSVIQVTGPTSTPISVTEVRRSYDAYGQSTQEKVFVDGTEISRFDMAWDAAARRTSLNFGLPGQGTGTAQGLTRTFGYRADGNMTSLVQGGRTYSYDYNDTGLIKSKTSDFRSLALATRDSRGRITQQSLYLSGAATTFPLRETLVWNDDSTLKSYDVQRAGGTTPYNETRNYLYNSRNQLTSETFVPASGQASKTFGFEFDGNTPGGLGVLTKVQTNNGATGEFKNEIALIDAWMRSTAEGSGSKTVQVQGTAKGASKVEVKVNADPVPTVNYDGPNSSGDWNVTVPVLPGSSNTVTATATHPSGKATATTTSTFNVNGSFAGVKLKYDQAGNVIERIFNHKTQTLTWDATGRLIKVTERNGANTGYDWSAVYDPLGRRVLVKYTPVTANVTGAMITSKSYFDPLVEFLEIGIEIAGQRYWKVMGTDLIGVYGAMNGIGGLEAVIRESNGTISGAVTDYFGNVVASATTTSVTWNPTATTGYGPAPGASTVSLEKIAVAPSLVEVINSFAWRTRKVDITGFINMGARYYDYASTRFLSADPAGFGSDMSLYSYANGDPINHVDADGRLTYGFVKGFFLGSWASSGDKDQQMGIMLGAMVSKMVPIYGFFAVARDTLHAVYQLYQAANDMAQNGINGQNVFKAIMAAYSIYGGVSSMTSSFGPTFTGEGTESGVSMLSHYFGGGGSGFGGILQDTGINLMNSIPFTEKKITGFQASDLNAVGGNFNAGDSVNSTKGFLNQLNNRNSVSNNNSKPSSTIVKAGNGQVTYNTNQQTRFNPVTGIREKLGADVNLFEKNDPLYAQGQKTWYPADRFVATGHGGLNMGSFHEGISLSAGDLGSIINNHPTFLPMMDVQLDMCYSAQFNQSYINDLRVAIPASKLYGGFNYGWNVSRGDGTYDAVFGPNKTSAVEIK